MQVRRLRYQTQHTPYTYTMTRRGDLRPSSLSGVFSIARQVFHCQCIDSTSFACRLRPRHVVVSSFVATPPRRHVVGRLCDHTATVYDLDRRRRPARYPSHVDNHLSITTSGHLFLADPREYGYVGRALVFAAYMTDSYCWHRNYQFIRSTRRPRPTFPPKLGNYGSPP